MNKLLTIKEYAKALIKAIDTHSYNAEVDRLDTEMIILKRYIDNELKKLRSVLK